MCAGRHTGPSTSAAAQHTRQQPLTHHACYVWVEVAVQQRRDSTHGAAPQADAGHATL